MLRPPESCEGSSFESFELPGRGIGMFIIGSWGSCCGTNAKGCLKDFAVEAGFRIKRLRNRMFTIDFILGCDGVACAICKLMVEKMTGMTFVNLSGWPYQCNLYRVREVYDNNNPE